MRDDEAHSASRFDVGDAVARMPKHPKHGDARRGLVEQGMDTVNYPLRLDPFPVEARVKEFAVRHQIAHCNRHFDLGEVLSGREGIELYVFIEIELDVARVHSAVLKIVDGGLTRRLFGEKTRGPAPNK